MVVTINVNGLSLCHKASSGVVRNTLPDVCKTPPANNAPLPYPNVAFSRDLAKGTTTVKADGRHMCAIRGSEFSKSIGDEPGSGGGIKSNTHLDRATWLSWSPDVFLQGKPACRLTDKMLMNDGNTVSLGGLDQPPLIPEEIDDWLCDAACECRSVSAFQQCVANKIREHLYEGAYPSPDSRVWREVSMQIVNGTWQIIMNGAGTGPTSNPITPQGGIRPDIVTVDSTGRPTRMIEMKFPGDTYSKRQDPRILDNEYNSAAEDLDIEYDQIDVEEDCDCWGGPPPPGSPVVATSPVPETEEEGSWLPYILGGVAVGVAGIACAVAEPCGAAALVALGLGGSTAAMAN